MSVTAQLDTDYEVEIVDRALREYVAKRLSTIASYVRHGSSIDCAALDMNTIMPALVLIGRLNYDLTGGKNENETETAKHVKKYK